MPVTVFARPLCFNRDMPDSIGVESQAVEVNGFRISETTLRASTRIAPHAHDTAQICFVLEGSYVERLASGDRSLRAGWMHVRGADVRHANLVDDDDVLALVVAVDRDRAVKLSEEPRRVFADLAREIRAEIRRSDAASSTALEGLALLTLARLERMQREPAWLREAAAIIDRRWRERLSVATIAREIGVHASTLAVMFRRHYQMSVGERIRATRVDHAKVELATTRMPIAEIALRCGFYDQAHFARVFRDVTGDTPRRYRANS